jgi:hypothetical protein
MSSNAAHPAQFQVAKSAASKDAHSDECEEVWCVAEQGALSLSHTRARTCCQRCTSAIVIFFTKRVHPPSLLSLSCSHPTDEWSRANVIEQKD